MKYIPALFRTQYYYPITLAIVGVLAGLALAVVIWSGVISVEPYKMSIVSEVGEQGTVSGYFDFDNKSPAEFVVLKTYGGRFPAVELNNGRDQFIDVLRPRGKWFNDYPSFCFGDFDMDSLSEIYLFTISNDSILLNAYEPLGNNGHFIVNKYIDRCGTSEGHNDVTFESFVFYDEDRDGKMEFTFLLRAGFSLTPRRIYKLNIPNQILEQGVNCAAGFTQILPVDLNGDERMDFIAVGNAIENFPAQDTSKLFNDNSGWVVGFDNDLNRVLFSTEFSTNKPYLFACIREVDGEKYILVQEYEHTANQIYLSKLNFQGELLERKQIYHKTYVRLMNATSFGFEKIVITDFNGLYSYDNKLNLIESQENIGIPLTWEDLFEFNNNSGFHVFQNDNFFYLLDSQLKKVGKVMPKEYGLSRASSISLISKKSDHSFQFCIRTISAGEFIIDAEKRKFKHLEILFYLLVFTGFYLLFYVVFRFQYYFFNRRLVTEQKIQALQLQTVQNQLQPHFTFNVLNTIGSLIYKDQKETAYEYLNHFSDMLRSTIISGKQSDWMIDEELNFITTYVAMENLRFDNKFDLMIKISPAVDITFNLPKLIIQTFVENAISHGLMHKKDDCRLSLIIEEEGFHIVFIVEDNGIGREASGKLRRNNVGHGNRILENYMEVYNRLNKTKYIFTVTDLFSDDGDAGGTRVKLWVPKDYKGNTRT